MSILRPALLTFPMLLLACTEHGEPHDLLLDEPAEVELRCINCDWGPPLTNTHGLNGFEASAIDTTGDLHDGVTLLSVMVVLDSAPDHPVYDVHVQDGILYGTDEQDVVFAGPDFVGSLWTFEIEQTSATTELTITAFIEDEGRHRYELLGEGDPSNPESYYCREDPETGEQTAILFADLDVDVAGTHLEREHTIYLGCVSAAIGKAAMWGYGPWTTSPDLHQTATRAVRADYCGNGTAYTVEGTAIQLHDVLGVHDFGDPNELTEALWGPTGAQCLLEPRLYESEITCGGMQLPVCGTSDSFGEWPSALLWTKTWTVSP